MQTAFHSCVLSHTQTTVEDMVDEGLVEVLLKILKLNPYNTKMQQMVNNTLQTLIKSEKLAGEIGKRLGGQILVQSLKTQKDTVKTLDNATRILLCFIPCTRNLSPSCRKRLRVRAKRYQCWQSPRRTSPHLKRPEWYLHWQM